MLDAGVLGTLRQTLPRAFSLAGACATDRSHEDFLLRTCRVCSTMLHAMPSPPTTAAEALAWAQQAMTSEPRRYLYDTHVYKRMRKRNVTERSIWYAIKNATRCQRYVPDDGQLTDGTAWRIAGPDHLGETTSVGVETFVDHLGQRLLIITVF